jgi:hypothetical protein
MSVRTIATVTIGPVVALGLLLVRRLRRKKLLSAKSPRCAALEAADEVADFLCQKNGNAWPKADIERRSEAGPAIAFWPARGGPRQAVKVRVDCGAGTVDQMIERLIILRSQMLSRMFVRKKWH